MSNEAKKLADRKKNDILKKFLNAQQYTKILKKNASSLKDDSNINAIFQYDQIQNHPEIPQSAKLPSTQLSKELVYSMNMINNDSLDFDKKAKSKKSHGYNNDLTQSSSQIPYLKYKKSSYSQMQKSEGGNKSIKFDKEKSKIKEYGVLSQNKEKYKTKEYDLLSQISQNKQKSKTREYDVLSQNKEKYSSTILHESLGGIEKQQLFKLKSKKSYNYSNAHEYQSQKYSGQDQLSFKSGRKHQKLQLKHKHNNSNDKLQGLGPFVLSHINFKKLLNKVEELQSAIQLYRLSIFQLKKKIQDLSQKDQQVKMSQILIDCLKDDLIDQKVRICQYKVKSSQLKDRIYLQQNHLKEYEQILYSSIQKIGQDYQEQISKITRLQKQNEFLKKMLQLDLQNVQGQIIQDRDAKQRNKKQVSDSGQIQKLNKQKPDSGQTQMVKIQISKNISQLRQKVSKQKNKTNSNLN